MASIIKSVFRNRKNRSDHSPGAPADKGKVTKKAAPHSETTDKPSSSSTSAATAKQVSSVHDGDGSKTQMSGMEKKKDLWDLAYQFLKEDEQKKALIENYERILKESKGGSAASSTSHIGDSAGRDQQMEKVVHDKSEEVKRAQWKFTIFSQEVEVRKQYDRVVGAVIWAKDFIGQSISSEPHAALAWAGVCLVLPLLLNPSQQRNAAIQGLDTVSDLIRRSKVIDEIYFEKATEIRVKSKNLQDLAEDFKKKRLKLYSQILEFEARLVCYFSSEVKMLRDLAGWDSWDKMVKNIKTLAELTDNDRQIIDAEKMNAGITKLDTDMQDALHKLDGISKSIEDEFRKARHTREDRERQDILSWLSPLDSRNTQIDTLNRRQKGTGKWLFEEPAFRRWLCGDTRTLWCFGIPGAGKTVLASAIIDSLERRFYKDDVGIAYLYCRYKEQYVQTAEALVGSLVQQLVQKCQDVPKDVQDAYQNHAVHQPPTSPTLWECFDLLKSQLASLPSIFIVIDALDECEDRAQRDLCLQFQNLSNNVHLLITSRDIPELEELIKPSAKLEILANDNDIKLYLEGRITSAPRLKRNIDSEAKLQTLVIETICEQAKGMFLLAQFQMNSLVNLATSSAVSKQLKKLPGSLDAIYDEAMKRITCQVKGEDMDEDTEGIASKKKEDASIAKKVLSWLSYARRPLSLAEIQHAIAVEPTTTSLSKRDFIPEDILISVCAGIVIVEKESNIIQLVHHTAHEYFLKKRTVHFPDAERDIANACLTYLSFDSLTDQHPKTVDDVNPLLEENALLDYAAWNWADHAREVSDSVMEAALKFLEDTSRTSLCFLVIKARLFRILDLSQIHSDDGSGLHLCARFGMDRMLARMLESKPKVDVKDSNGRTPLWIAAERGKVAVAELLISNDAAVDAEDQWGQTPLSRAAEKGYEAMVRLLVEHGAAVNPEEDPHLYKTPLWIAAENGYENVVEYLHSKGASVDVVYGGETPLGVATTNGNEAVVKLLLGYGATMG